MINKNIMILFSNNNYYENDKILEMLGPVIYIVKTLLKNIKKYFIKDLLLVTNNNYLKTCP